MKVEQQAREFQSESFKEYDQLLRELHRLERAGEAETDGADQIRNRMDAPYRRLSKKEVEHFRSLAESLNARQSGSARSARDVLSTDVEIKGIIKFEHELLIDCAIEGEINSRGLLIIGKNGDVRGEIKTRSAIVFGKVQGNIIVTERCELKSSCTLEGDLKAARLIIEEGATFIGKLEIASRMNVTAHKTYGRAEIRDDAHEPVEAGVA
jgi:cytoskeletal protein CcmA (bactofilin family)